MSYSTPRTVNIRDWRLGVLSYTLTISALSYIVIYTLIIEQRYRLRAVDVLGTVRLSLQPPTSAYWSPPGSPGGSYCSPNDVDYPVPLQGCRYLDQYDTQPTPMEASALFLTTRVSITNFTANTSDACGGAQLQPSCSFIPMAEKESFFVGDVEFYTMLIDHGFTTGAPLSITASASSIPGRIVGPDGKTVLDPCDDYKVRGWACPSFVKVGPVGVGAADIMPINTLLRAAGVASLDAPNGVNGSESMRFGGTLLVMTITYSNFLQDTNAYSENYITYTYSVEQVDGVEFKTEQPVPAAGAGTAPSRTVLDRHGIRLLVKQSGNLGRFDFATLLVSLTASLGLLAASTLIVDCLAVRVLPLRAVYNGYKTSNTVDFEELERLRSEDLARIVREDLVNPKPPFLTEIRSIEESRSSRVLGMMRGGSGSGGRTGADSSRADLLASPSQTLSSPPGSPNPLNALRTAMLPQAIEGGGIVP